MLLTTVAMIGWHVIWMSSHGKEMVRDMQQVAESVKAGSSSVAMLLAVLREGSEIVLFPYDMAAGLFSTAAGFLIQADWLSARQPVVEHLLAARQWLPVRAGTASAGGL